jgi:hypothetical protein
MVLTLEIPIRLPPCGWPLVEKSSLHSFYILDGVSNNGSCIFFDGDVLVICVLFAGLCIIDAADQRVGVQRLGMTSCCCGFVIYENVLMEARVTLWMHPAFQSLSLIMLK